MNEREMLNEPVRLPLAGRELRWRQLGIAKMRAMAEAWIEEQGIARIKRLAMVFDDKDARMAYMDRKLDELPSDSALTQAAIVLLCGDGAKVKPSTPDELTARFMVAACQNKKIGEAEMGGLLEDATSADVRAVLLFLTDAKKKPSRRRASGTRSVKSSRRPTAACRPKPSGH